LLDSNRGFEYSSGLDMLFEAIDKTPRQCLANEKADAIKEFTDYCHKEFGMACSADGYIYKLREGKL